MTDQSGHTPSSSLGGSKATPAPILAEDLLLLLFQPDTGTVAGEGTLFYVLAGAVLADLGLGGHLSIAAGWSGIVTVAALAGCVPADHVLRASWEYFATKPREVQTVLPAIGPVLREPLLDRLVARGDLRRRTRTRLAIFESTVIEEGDTERRPRLLAEVRAVLVDGVEPDPRVAALAGLLYASGTLPQFDPDIPWTSAVIARAERLRAASGGASAAAEAVGRTVTANIVNQVIVAAAARRS